MGSTSVAIVESIHQGAISTPLPMSAMAAAPMMPRGLPGVAILDYDNDGDRDFYVTNGPGRANSLFQNQLMQTGVATFVDVAGAAGVGAADQDSFGTCFGDLDNDGDHDLMVLGRLGGNRLFENNGDGTFSQLALAAGLDGGSRTSTGCSMGDLDNDGLLDIVVANSFDQTFSFAIMVEPYDDNEHNQLLMNLGDLQFEDASDSSGITVNQGYPEGAAGITWALTVTDVDSDGDADVIFLDDQGAIPAARHPEVGGFDRAYIHVFLNDGTGHFLDDAILEGPNAASEWMGVSVGDLNCDGNLDFLATSFGDYGNPAVGLPYIQGGSMSRPFFGNGDGTFTDPGNSFGVSATPFGWGSAVYDSDNDGDLDLLFHGGLDAANLAVINDNPGALLQNQGCSGQFVADTGAITADHLHRNVRGMAVGDLNNDGFNDIVTVANLTTPPELPNLPAPVSYGSPYDATAFVVPIMFPVGATPEGVPTFLWSGFENGNGDLKVELATPNTNASVTFDTVGTVGLIPRSCVNRDGIGAQVTFTPRGGTPAMQQVTGGSSHSSQHAIDRVFGMGQARRGTADVLWPGGVRNRHYNVRPGDQVLPEIPCSYDTSDSIWRYARCVRRSVRGLRHQGVISRYEGYRIFSSAIRAYREAH